MSSVCESQMDHLRLVLMHTACGLHIIVYHTCMNIHELVNSIDALKHVTIAHALMSKKHTEGHALIIAT